VTVSISRRIVACLAYLLPLLGWIYALIVHRRDRFILFHVRQAASIVLVPAFLTLLWAIVGWVLALTPIGGPLAAGLFSLVMVAYLVAAVDWIIGLVQAATGRAEPVPVLGRVALRFPLPASSR